MTDLSYAVIEPAYFLRSEAAGKRLLFLRSYQFSRKQTLAQKIKKAFFRLKKVIWVRFRSVRKMRKRLWIRFRNGVVFSAGRRGVAFRRLYAAASASGCCYPGRSSWLF